MSTGQYVFSGKPARCSFAASSVSSSMQISPSSWMVRRLWPLEFKSATRASKTFLPWTSYQIWGSTGCLLGGMVSSGAHPPASERGTVPVFRMILKSRYGSSFFVFSRNAGYFYNSKERMVKNEKRQSPVGQHQHPGVIWKIGRTFLWETAGKKSKVGQVDL